jgi:NADH-quinone oxidoreductase subunit J
MDPSIPFLACLVGAAAMFAMLRPGPKAVRGGAGVVGLGVFAWMLVEGVKSLAGPEVGGVHPNNRPEVFFLIFSLIAVASAVRMITHSRPVYCALYFVMVVLSSAALFLLLEAEFMAFALVIVYAGAILITYMFVLMLAQQSPQADQPDAQPEYDVVAREPAAAAVVGFIMLWLLTSMIFDQAGGAKPAQTPMQAEAEVWSALNQMPKQLEAVVKEAAPGASFKSGSAVTIVDGQPMVSVNDPATRSSKNVLLPESLRPNNIQMVGMDLVAKFPVSLELAGVILLMAMFGAVVLARKQIEMGEDETREAAGMRRLDLHADEDQLDGGPDR